MNTVDLFSPLARGLVVVGLAAGLATSALPAAQAAAPGAQAAPQNLAISAPLTHTWAAEVIAPAAVLTATVACATPYTVQSGDTLWRIGLKSGVEWPQIAAQNSLANPALIYAGQTLCLPAAGTVPVTATTTAANPILPSGTPTLEVVSVAADQTVTIRASNFPANKLVNVRMGKNGSLGAGGALVTTVDADTGAFTGTYPIPATLQGQSVIAIRLESQWGGYFSYSWFFNTPTK